MLGSNRCIISGPDWGASFHHGFQIPLGMTGTSSMIDHELLIRHKQVNQRKTLEENYLIQLYGSWSGRISLIYHAASDFGGLICQLKKLLASYFYWQVSVVWDSWFILPLLIVTTNEFSFTDIFCYQHLFSGKTNLPWSINSHVLLREHTNGWNITSQ